MNTPTFLGNILFIGTALLLLGWGFSSFLRRQPAWENALWRTLLLLLLILPVVQALTPRTFGMRWAQTPRTEQVTSGQKPPAIAPFLPPSTGNLKLSSAPPPTPPPAKPDHLSPTFWRGLLLIWLVGTAASLAGLIADAWKVHRWTRRARALSPEEPRASTLAACARVAGVRPRACAWQQVCPLHF